MPLPQTVQITFMQPGNRQTEAQPGQDKIRLITLKTFQITWSDRNKNLGIKQFYSCAIRPEANSDYILAGAQDNGVHQIKTPGKTYSWEVTGGDGGFVDISQTNPNLQFGSYVYNQYRRSTNGGASWTSVTFSSTIGRFINPFDYDELSDALYASYGTNTLLRWNTPATTSSSTNLTVTGLGTASAITASPYTLGTVYAGSTAGQVFKITDANTAAGPTTSSSISDAAMTGVVSCIAVGTSDNTLVAVMSNYSINNVWYSNNGGVSWSQIDGNLPDMPVRWAVFQPGSDSRLIIATEAGVYTSNIIDGSNTQWSPSPGFPTVRTDMLRVRANDQLLVAATHGRGLWSANVLQVLPVRDLTLKASLQGTGQSQLNWTSSGAIPATRFHIQFSTDGRNFRDVGEVPYNMNRFTHVMTEMAGYYRIVSAEPNSAPVISNTVLVRNNNSRGLQISIAPNPVRSTMTVLLSGGENGNYRWEIVTSAGQVMLRGSGSSQQNTTHSVPVNVASLPSGMYWLRLLQGSKSISESFLKQ
ncbi:MAG: T9SS type A sorting domain-containing protein [Chitinophagaceae bacterium]|nr:MAG: T9SS type A sorting domain-containing protein [Chitinophagaceae bacterium]